MKDLLQSEILAQQAGLDIVIRTSGGTVGWSDERLSQHREAEVAKRPPPNVLWRLENRLGHDLILSLAIWVACFGVGVPGAIIVATTGEGAWFLYSALLYMALLPLIARLPVRGPAKWNTYDVDHVEGIYLSDYTGITYVPVKVRDFMQRVKSLRPDARFQIEALEQEERKLDPIIHVIAGNERSVGLVYYETKGKAVIVLPT